jgi:hypothetical protein
MADPMIDRRGTTMTFPEKSNVAAAPLAESDEAMKSNPVVRHQPEMIEMDGATNADRTMIVMPMAVQDHEIVGQDGLRIAVVAQKCRAHSVDRRHPIGVGEAKGEEAGMDHTETADEMTGGAGDQRTIEVVGMVRVEGRPCLVRGTSQGVANGGTKTLRVLMRRREDAAEGRILRWIGRSLICIRDGARCEW